MTRRVPRSALALAALAVAGIYFFVTAPPALPDAQASAARDIPVETLFRLLDAENASVRSIYTRDVVGPGMKQGLQFREDWKQDDVHAGPLPALMLRETASRLQQRVPELNLFLGSTYPIEASNLFVGEQEARFALIENDRQPQIFLDASTGRHTAMFPDIASAPACVTCHNEHPKTPRTNWVLNDVMGATTWSFPRATVSTDEVVTILAAFRASALDAYDAYLRKVPAFDPASRPVIGAQWPGDGAFLPDVAAFRARVEQTNSAATLNLLLRSRTEAKAGGEEKAAARTDDTVALR